MSGLVIYTDGACSGNPGPGGWAWAVAPTGEPHGSGGEARTTNQRMEIHAVLDALQTHARLADDFKDRWWVKWQRNGWVNSQRKPVANVDLWEPLIEVVQAGDVSFRWVKGHSGDRMNDLVDRLAVEAIPNGR